MKTTLLLALLALLPACQTGVNQQLVDADRQLESYQTVNNGLLVERERIRAENASLSEQLTFEQSRADDLAQRVKLMASALPLRVQASALSVVVITSLLICHLQCLLPLGKIN